MDRDSLDRAVSVAAYSAAGEIQKEVAETGVTHVSEADLRRAIRSGVQSQLGRTVFAEVAIPRNSSWKGRLGGVDVGVLEDQRLVAAIELKWCREKGKLAEALWDALKLSPQTIDGGEMVATYMAYAAAESAWSNVESLPTELFESTTHDIRALLQRHDKHWRWLAASTKTVRPTDLRSQLTTTLIAAVPIHNPRGEDWVLKCVRLLAEAAPTVFFDGDGLVAEYQPAFGAPAPASRFVDGVDDFQIDPASLPENRAASLPENRALLRQLDNETDDGASTH